MKAGPYKVKAYALALRFDFFFLSLGHSVLKNIKISKHTEFQEFGALLKSIVAVLIGQGKKVGLLVYFFLYFPLYYC